MTHNFLSFIFDLNIIRKFSDPIDLTYNSDHLILSLAPTNLATLLHNGFNLPKLELITFSSLFCYEEEIMWLWNTKICVKLSNDKKYEFMDLIKKFKLG